MYLIKCALSICCGFTTFKSCVAVQDVYLHTAENSMCLKLKMFLWSLLQLSRLINSFLCATRRVTLPTSRHAEAIAPVTPHLFSHAYSFWSHPDPWLKIAFLDVVIFMVSRISLLVRTEIQMFFIHLMKVSLRKTGSFTLPCCYPKN